ncbi:MAG: hypothetical protein HQ558_05510 [Candidatus Omnitrophica bacterium]|nr:hypothetical protein [Candidatus Omnitrophota bacterium]
MRKLIVIAAALMLVINTAVPASAFTSDVTRILSAEADLYTSVPDQTTLNAPVLRLVSNNSVKTDNAGTPGVDESQLLSWTYDAGKSWKVANEYIEIGYGANLAGWGIQIYTDNTNASADPQWTERPDPANARPNDPAGLIGSTDPNSDGDATDAVNFIAIPLAWKSFPGGSYVTPAYSDGSAFDGSTEYRTNYTEPQERAFGDPATDDYYVELYQYKSGSGASEKLYGKYCWVTDKASQKWTDANSNSTLDGRDTNSDGVVDDYEWSDTNTNGVMDAGEGEIAASYADGAELNTVVDYLGTNTCTYDVSRTFMYRDIAQTPIYLVLAANIAAGTIKSTYSTNRLTLELYHE